MEVIRINYAPTAIQLSATNVSENSPVGTIVAAAVLTDDIVKMLEDNSFKISVKRGPIAYNIPAGELSIASVIEKLDLDAQQSKNIQFEIQIANVNDALIKSPAYYNAPIVKTRNGIYRSNGLQLYFSEGSSGLRNIDCIS